MPVQWCLLIGILQIITNVMENQTEKNKLFLLFLNQIHLKFDQVWSSCTEFIIDTI